MTRETKIGLLVGLAFVIVIGILLSDHITRSMQPPQAALAASTEAMDQGLTTPGRVRGNQGDVRVPAVEPDRVVRTQSDPAMARIQIGPRPNEQQAARSTDPSPLDNMVNVLAQDTARSAESTSGDVDLQPSTTKEYTAAPGDTLSRIARKFMGKDTPANRDAIVKANPSIQKDRNRIIAGHKYMIPLNETASARDDTSLVRGPATRPSGTDIVYTTKQGDSLWKIATEQVGSGAAVAQIRELNRDVLKNGDKINPGIKLKLPAKQVASAN
jgi:nucleoid-associated protein YgaU